MPSSQVMEKFKAGTLHSGSKQGPKVQNPMQAVAIKYSEQAKEKANKRKTGSAFYGD